MHSTIPFLFISVDNEKIKPPVMEGIDALVAVSGAFYITLYFINYIVLFLSISFLIGLFSVF
jgi:DMSO/TMAO reductase YedYZ heme-binding membrane subunit